jgi:hypothetical protein
LRTVFSNGAADISTIWNLSTGALVLNAGDHQNPTITNVGNGWYRCSITYTPATVPAFPLLFRLQMGVGTNLGFTASSGDGFLAYGAQINNGAIAPYFPTTDRLNVPRLTYQNGGGGCPSLLLEKQSTNYARNWDFTAAIWSKSIVNVTANAGTSPDGTNNAYLIYPTSSGTDRFLYDDQGSSGYSANANYTTTVYAKAAGLNWAYIRFEDKTNTSSYVYFNLSTGAVGSTTGSVTIISKTIEAMGNGWYRLRVTANMGTGTGGNNNVLFGVADADASTQATTSGTNGVLFYGPQSEQSDYPTSAIFTSGASATRVADACFKTGISSLIGQTEGTMFVDLNFNGEIFGLTNNYYIYIGNGSNTNAIYIDQYNNNFRWVVFDGTTLRFFTDVAMTTGRHKLALAYKNNDYSAYLDGTLITTQTLVSGAVPTCSQFSLIGNVSNFDNDFKQINQAVLFPTRLTNAELASLTTI